MKFLTTLLLLMLSTGAILSQDSSAYKIHNAGLFLEGEILGSNLFNSNYGNSLGVGGFMQKQLLDRVRLKFQVGLRKKKYTRPVFTIEHFENSDTMTILDRFDSNRSSLRITSGIGVNFYYIQTENFNLFLGVNYLPEFVIKKNNAFEYAISTYRGSGTFEDAIRANTIEPVFRDFWYDRIYELGIGIEFRRVSLEFLLRAGRKYEYSNNFGIRISSTIFNNIR